MSRTLERMNSRLSSCKRCRSMNQGQKRVQGAGVLNPLVFLLGESPGRLGADQTGIPFTRDRSGELLRELLKQVELSPQKEAYFSNIVKCNPRDEQGRNRRPSSEEIANCREYLLTELKAVKAQVIVPLGELASQELLGKKLHMNEINAKECHNRAHGTIFPLYHPGYIVRGNYSLVKYRQDFKRLRRLVRHE